METGGVEFLDDVGNENESIIWENVENSAAMHYVEGVEGDGTVMQSTHYTSSVTQYRYFQYTESGESVEINPNEYPELLLAPDSHHRCSLVLAAIDQMPNNAESNGQTYEEECKPLPPFSSIQSADVTQSGDITTTAGFHMDIKAEENVGTPTENDGENAVGPSRPKRQRKVMPDYAEYLKERANARAAPKASTSSGEATKTSKPPVKLQNPESNLTKAIGKRKSAIRKTISGSKSEILDQDDGASVAALTGK